MAINFAKTNVAGTLPAIWRGEVKMLPGGFEPGQAFPVGTTLKRGLPLYVDFDQRKAYVCKTAVVLAGGAINKPRVAKGHCFAVGDVVMKDGVTTASPTISSIDSSNEDYDVLNLSASITGLTAGDYLAEATAYIAAGEGVAAVDAAPKYNPNAIVGSDLEYTGKGIPTIDAGYDALVIKGNAPAPFLADWIESGMCLKGNHSIKLIKQ